MQYLGSKRRIAKFIGRILGAEYRPGQSYVEPFVGGANMIETIDWAERRIASDIDPELLAMYRAGQTNWSPPTVVTEAEYSDMRSSGAGAPHLRGFVSIGCSFGSRKWGGYARNSAGRNYAAVAARGFLRDAPKLAGVMFVDGGYEHMHIPAASLIYCDPPYADTTRYAAGNFDHGAFWQWCRDRTTDGHTVFVSEYTAPYDFGCVWEKEHSGNIAAYTARGAKRSVEKLFKYDPLF